MSEAIKCDRCKCLSDYIGLKKIAVTAYTEGRDRYDKRKDLCEECQNSLEKWWKNV